MTIREAEIALSIIKDLFGLAGSLLVALPFFRLERSKRQVAGLRHPPTRNELLLKAFVRAELDAKDKADAPSVPDFSAMSAGLVLIGLSFLISLLLTFLAWLSAS